MPSATGPPPSISSRAPYTGSVPRTPSPSKGPRPAQGARLLALRKAAGLTQTELAQFLGVPQANIAFWEWSDKPPRSDLLPKLAKALDVTVERLLASSEKSRSASSRQPVGEVQRAFEEVRKLPRRQQRKIVETVYALVEQYKRKAS
jgi:transcriptional regulator with XRE-family HTH domain